MARDHELAVLGVVLGRPGTSAKDIVADTGIEMSVVLDTLNRLYRRGQVVGELLTGDDSLVAAPSVFATDEGKQWHDAELARSVGTSQPGAPAVKAWEERAVPLFRAVAAREGFGNVVTVEDLAEATSLSHEQVDTELIRLIDAGYLQVATYSKTMAAGRRGHWKFVSPVIAERGTRAIGMWPTNDPYELLVQLLERQISEEPNEERKGKLRRLRDDLGDIGKGTASALLVELVKLGAGMA